MKAMIFAAGTGTRLKPWTDFHPKALAEVGGVPILGRVIERLKKAGVTRMVVNVHHFASQVTDYLNANGNFGVEIAVSDESQLLLDTGGGLLKARHMLDDGSSEPILLHNADILTDSPVIPMLEAHNASEADATLLVSSRPSSRQLYFRDGELCAWGNSSTGDFLPSVFTPDGAVGMAFGGVHIVSPKVFDSLADYAAAHGERFSITPFYVESIGKLRIRSFVPQEAYMWHDIGTPAKLAAAEKDVSC